MSRPVIWASSLACILLGAGLAAAQTQRRPVAAAPAQDRFDGYLRLQGWSFDNFSQTPEGQPDEDVLAYSLEGQLAARIRRDSALQLYFEGDRIGYDSGFSPAGGLAVGLRSDGSPHAYDVSAGLHWDRPVFDVGDELESADAVRVEGRYAYRVSSDWELGAQADFQHETYELRPPKNNDLLGAGGSVRFRGFGPLFSPEVGVIFWKRDAVDDNEDHSQRDLFARVRSQLLPRVYVSARVRRRLRDYSISDAGSRNLGREDRRTQLTFGTDLRATERLTLNLYYAVEDADSTRPTRVFKTHLAAVGATVGF